MNGRNYKISNSKFKPINLKVIMGKVIKTKLVPKGICLNFFGLFLTQDKSWIDKYVVNHELIHTAQQKEMLWIPFYIVYLIEWVIRLCQHLNWHKAYMSISFEKEAYKYGNDLQYLKNRKCFAQWRV